jgi:hypothetical protein
MCITSLYTPKRFITSPIQYCFGFYCHRSLFFSNLFKTLLLPISFVCWHQLTITLVENLFWLSINFFFYNLTNNQEKLWFQNLLLLTSPLLIKVRDYGISYSTIQFIFSIFTQFQTFFNN